VSSHFLSLRAPEQGQFLASMIHHLTVSARARYRPAVNLSPEGFRKFVTLNELIHSCAGQLLGFLSETTRYPDDVFLRVPEETAGELCSAELRAALDFAASREPLGRKDC
jgi:hypothetical protein